MKGEKAHITLKKVMKPHISHSYNLPRAYKELVEKENERMVAVRIFRKLKWNEDSLWALPTFATPKKTCNL